MQRIDPVPSEFSTIFQIALLVQNIDIVGAGPAGLYAALLLKKRNPGLHVCVHERRRRNHRTGLGIILYGETLSDLFERDVDLGARVAAHARTLEHISVRHQDCWTRVSQANLYSIARQTLIDSLIERCHFFGVEIRWDTAVSSLDALSDSDLVVIADGARSALRDAAAALVGVRKSEYRNHYLWMYIEGEFDGFVFDFQPCEFAQSREVAVLHAYPFATDRSSVIIELPAGEAASLLAQCNRQREPVAGILSGMFSHALAGRRLQFADDATELSMERFHTVRCANWVLPVHDGVPPAVLMGDAARTAHFSVGSGTRLGLGDAGALADCFPDLHAYERKRMRISERIQHKAQLSMDWFGNVARFMHLPPDQFTQSLLRRAEDRAPVLERALLSGT